MQQKYYSSSIKERSNYPFPVLYYGYNGTPFVLTALHQPVVIKFLCADSKSNFPGGAYEKFPVSGVFSDVNHSTTYK
jgi:hypothetical protein